MRVLIATQVYPPETAPTAVMVEDLAEFLAAQGHDVTVAAGHPHHPGGTLPPGWRRRFPTSEEQSTVRIIRGWHFVSASRSIAARGAVMLSQAVGVMIAAFNASRPEVVITFGLPLVGPVLMSMVARRFRAKHITVISDIYPDVAIETGKLTSPLAIRGLRALESRMYRWSARVVVLSERFRRTLIGRGVPQEKLRVIPVWLSEGEMQPLVGNSDWRRRHAISAAERLVLYAGTIGFVSGADVIVDAAQIVRDRAANVTFVLVGEGSVKRDLESAAAGAPNLRFLPFEPRDRVPEMLAAADVCLVTLAPGRGRTSVPSKVVAYMAAGKATIGSVDTDSDTADLIRESGGGWVTTPGRGPELANTIIEAVSAPEELKIRGSRARAWFLTNYSKTVVLQRYEELIRELGGS